MASRNDSLNTEIKIGVSSTEFGHTMRLALADGEERKQG